MILIATMIAPNSKYFLMFFTLTDIATILCRLLNEKQRELGDARDKLRNGLSKIDDTREKVEKMSVELEVAKQQVATYQKQCDEFLKTLVQQKREADEQQKVGVLKEGKGEVG